MRENMALYRGKRKDNGAMVEGFIITTTKANVFIVNTAEEYGCGICIQESVADQNYEVDPETVGQFTGLTDKNGVKIFEGDILRIIERGETIDGGIVAFRNEYPGGWLVMDKAYESKCSLAMRNDVEITGNIHDNPELLEVK